MRTVLGIDGGGSKTLALLADETGRVLGTGRAGCANHQVTSLEEAMAEVRRAAEQALVQAGATPDAVDAAFYALAGADLEADFAQLGPAVAGLGLARTWALENDMMAALRSGTDSENAVVVSLGSGTNALGRNAGGAQIRLPGLGWLSGDWGGAGDMAREAIRMVARSWDGRGPATALEELILTALGAPNVAALIGMLYEGRVPREQILGLVPLIFTAAEAGDGPARELVARAGAEVAVTALALLRRLDLLAARADLVLAGSIFRSESQLLLDTIADQIYQAAPDTRIVLPDVEPVVGAVLCGMDTLHIPTDTAVRGRLSEMSGVAPA